MTVQQRRRMFWDATDSLITRYTDIMDTGFDPAEDPVDVLPPNIRQFAQGYEAAGAHWDNVFWGVN